MPIDRDSLRTIVVNDNEKYDDILAERGVFYIEHYTTKKLTYPTPAQMRNLNVIYHLWKVGDKYWKLADTHYGNSTLWWILAWYNKKPTEAHCKTGDTILIPRPLSTLYRYFGL